MGWTSVLGVFPVLLGFQKLWQLRADLRRRDGDSGRVQDRKHTLERRTRSEVLALAGVTMANGGDNLAVYIPVFATDVQAIPVYMVVFALMTGPWCVAGYKLVTTALAGEHIRRYGHVLLPVVLDDLRALPLVERKRRLARIMPRVDSRLMLLDAIRARGTRLYELACERDLEGIVAKWACGTYQCDGRGTSWLKIKNPEYSQIHGRHELFAVKHAEWRHPRTKAVAPALALR